MLNLNCSSSIGEGGNGDPSVLRRPNGVGDHESEERGFVGRATSHVRLMSFLTISPLPRFRRHAAALLRGIDATPAKNTSAKRLSELHKNRRQARAAIFPHQPGWDVRLIGSQLEVV